MKKTLRIALALLLVLASLFITGCGSSNESNTDNTTADPTVTDFGDDVTYISDATYYGYYIAFTTNSKDYVGKKFAVDGMFHVTTVENKDVPQVFRYHREVDPTDGKEYSYYRGFLLRGDAVKMDTAEKAWVRVIGTLESEVHDDHAHVYLNVESFELLDAPSGKDTVE